MDVYCIGEMVIDFTPGTEKNSYIRNPGGAPANVAIALRRLGRSSAFCGKLGEDDFGRFLEKTLRDEDVRIGCRERTDKAVTTMAFVTLGEDGERSFTFARKPGADMLLSPSDVDTEDLAKALYVHGGSCSMSAESSREATEYALRTAHELGKLVSFDVNYRAPQWDGSDACADAVRTVLPYVDVLKIASEEAELFGGEESIPALMRQYSIALAAVTNGAGPVTVYWQGEAISQRSIPTDAVDTTGAGDAFWAAFLAALIESGVETPLDLNAERIRTALRWGVAAGHLTVQRAGAIPALPTLEELTAVLEKELA